MKKIISVANHKGGVGKTTTTINLTAGLQRLNKKILCIDLDPQANLTQSLGVRDIEYSIYHSLTQNSELKICNVIEGVDLVPSEINLSGAEIELINEPGREYILKGLLTPHLDKYDYVFIDCPPSLGLLTINAFVASTEVLIPLQAQFLATQGMSKILEIIKKVKDRLNKELLLNGIVLTQFNKRKILNRDIAKSIDKHFSDKLFNTRIRENISLAEAPVEGLDIFRYNDKCIGALDYAELAIEFLNRKVL